MWTDRWDPLAMVTVCTMIAIIIGLPIGYSDGSAPTAQLRSFNSAPGDVCDDAELRLPHPTSIVISASATGARLIAVVIYAVPPMIA